MTLNINEPTDQRMVSELPGFIRQTRIAINAVSGSGNVGASEIDIPLGTTSLTVGTDLGLFGFESVMITGLGLATLETILGGTHGQVKVFVFQNALVRLADDLSKAGGTFYLNHLPAGDDFEPDQDDVLAVMNIGGNGGATPGYWIELYRTISVK